MANSTPRYTGATSSELLFGFRPKGRVVNFLKEGLKILNGTENRNNMEYLWKIATVKIMKHVDCRD